MITLEQNRNLGYIWDFSFQNYRGVLGCGFNIQSSDKSCDYIISKTKEFLNEQREIISNLTDEEYEIAVEAVIMQNKQIDMNLCKILKWNF